MIRKRIAIAELAIAALVLLPTASALASEMKPHVDTSGVNMQPAYPATALPTKESGSVVISALIDTDGMVRRVMLRQSSGYADLDTAAANAVNGWKFVPGLKDGEPVNAWADVQIVFTPPN